MVIFKEDGLNLLMVGPLSWAMFPLSASVSSLAAVRQRQIVWAKAVIDCPDKKEGHGAQIYVKYIAFLTEDIELVKSSDLFVFAPWTPVGCLYTIICFIPRKSCCAVWKKRAVHAPCSYRTYCQSMTKRQRNL